MSLFDLFLRKPNYWGWEKGDSFGFSMSTRMNALDAHGKAHKETLLKIGPWYRREGGNDLLVALFREKGCSKLIDLSDRQVQRIFGRSKQDVVDTFMSGCVGSEMYVVGMVLIAAKLHSRHGQLKEVRLLDNPHRIELTYTDGSSIAFNEPSGHPDVTMMNFGYSGTGTECLYAFLNESGFGVTMDQLEKVKPPMVLKKSKPGTVTMGNG